MTIRSIKKSNSDKKISELQTKLCAASELEPFADLTIFATGSYARGEASEFSDIDLFFVSNTPLENISDPNIKSLRMFSKIISVCDELDFPKFSNDGEFLEVLEKPTILEHLGARDDDHLNHFTARLLLILEIRCIFCEDVYESILKSILEAYFRDYPDHPKDFKPTFLVNDILRFWKTLCLNYENKRNQPDTDQEKQIKQKIKNLKLKFSRMLTCFGSICYIVSQNGSVDHRDIFEMSKLSPLERLEHACQNYPELKVTLSTAVEEYEWFLELTNVPEEELRRQFSEREFRVKAFARASVFGDAIFTITKSVAEKNNYLRFLLV